MNEPASRLVSTDTGAGGTKDGRQNSVTHAGPTLAVGGNGRWWAFNRAWHRARPKGRRRAWNWLIGGSSRNRKSPSGAANMLSVIVKKAYCPVIAIFGTRDSPWVKEAAERGAFGYIVDDKPAELQSAIEFPLRRFAEAHSIHAAVDRRTGESRLEIEANRNRQRSALELYDGVVQCLATAQLAHEMGLEGPSAEALKKALDLAKVVISRSLKDLQESGFTTAQLIRDSSTTYKE
jgi:signal transduction histidine kinase